MTLFQLFLVAALASALSVVAASSPREVSFTRQTLIAEYWCDGVNAADINGDGLTDLVLNEGWWEQPAQGAPAGTLWKKHAFTFSSDKGGAQILVYDVNGDGKNDVVTAMDAHGFGLSWFEQTRVADGAVFIPRLIDDASGLGTQIVSVDMNSDGVPDVLTASKLGTFLFITKRK